MYRFSERSWTRLRTCEPALQRVIVEAMGYQIMDFTILQGRRTLEQQRRLVEQGFSTTMNSLHLRNPSQAVDIAPWPIDWDDIKRFYTLGGIVLAAAKAVNIPIRWGGDWDGDSVTTDQSFNDPGHFELKQDMQNE